MWNRAFCINCAINFEWSRCVCQSDTNGRERNDINWDVVRSGETKKTTRRVLYTIQSGNRMLEICSDIPFAAIVRARVCLCVCVCVCISFHRKGFYWLNKTINVMPEIRPAMLCWGNYCVKYLRHHVIDNHSRDLQASNCERVSIKPGRATRSKRQFIRLSKNQR